MYINRAIKDTFLKSGSFFPVILITGPRQVGKTTFLQHAAEPERKYVSLDNHAFLSLAKNDPEGFLDRFPPPVLIDEIQYAPELMPYIKIAVDQARYHNLNNNLPSPGGMFWLTGSQQFELMRGITESLAGRVGILNIQGFSQCELDKRQNVPFLPEREPNETETEKTVLDYFKTIWLGSFPQLLTAPDKENYWSEFYSSYIQTYLERDVRAILQVSNLEIFYNFLRAVTARSGQLLNYSNLARSVDISVPTAKKWINILCTSGLVYLLEPYHNNQLKRMIKTPKLYVLDTGLCAYLGNWNSPEALESGAISGEIFETWCFSEILKSYFNAGKRPSFSFYRDNDQREIDLLIEENGTLYPIEFKKTATPKKDAIRNFKALEKTNMQIGQGAVICTSKIQLPLTRKCQTIPAVFI
jgi:predicted AAA+ superfamily ATPase